MFDAGAAVFTLTGRVVREPFDSYGKLVESARANKEHRILLGADTSPVGFDRFQGWLDRTKQSIRDFAVTARGEFDTVVASTDKMGASSDRSLRTVRDSVAKTAESYRVYGAEVVRTNRQIEDSNRMAGGGGGAGGTRTAMGAGGHPEEQAKKTTAAWKEGLGTLTNMGKWASLAAGAVGVVTIKWAADFQRQMELVHTQAGYAQKDVDHLNKAVLDLAPAVGIGPAKLAQGLFHIASAGIPASHAIEVLRIAAEGAKVGNSDLEHTTNALVAILRTAPKDIHGAAEAMGVMTDIVGHGNLRLEDLTAALTTGVLPAAKGVGLGLRDLGSALDVLTARGVPAEQAATRLRTTLNLIANPTSKAQKALGELGLTDSQLAKDMREHGLVTALEDLQKHLDSAFPPGRRLTVDQEREALTRYGNQLAAAGVSGKTLQKDLLDFKHRMDETGGAAIKQGQIINQAFGGARMGTTMMTLMQNIDDVRKHTEELHKSGAAQRFQQDWAATQKDFSVQVSQMAAALQRWGIQLGDYLIPKVKDLVKWLIEAGKWLGHHKVLADALAIAFGTLLVGAIAAFFGKLVLGAARGLKSIGELGKGIYQLPAAMQAATDKIVANLREQQKALQATRDEAAGLNDTLGAEGAGMAEGGAAGAGGGMGGLGGLVEGMIVGVRGTMAPGSVENPLAVMVLAGEPFGLSERVPASEAKTLSQVEGEARAAGQTPGGVFVPGSATRKGGSMVTAAEEEAAMLDQTALPAVEKGGSRLAGLVGMAGSGASKLMGAAGMAGMGLIGAQLAGSVVGGKAGGYISSIGSGASIGAAAGSILPGPGTLIGAGLGAAVAGVIHSGLAKGVLDFLSGADYGKQIADHLTKGFGGPAAQQLKDSISKALNDAHKLATSQHVDIFGQVTGLKLTDKQKQEMADDFHKAGTLVAKQLEAGWNQYKFQSEPTMFTQLKAEIKKMPPAAQAAAIESAFKFAQGLESQGRLAKGGADHLLEQAKKDFPGFGKYLGLSAKASVKTFVENMKLDQAERNVRNTLNRMRGDFPQVTAAMDNTSGNIQKKSAAVVHALETIIHGKNSTEDMRKSATSDLNRLRQSAVSDFDQMANVAESKVSDMASSVHGNLSAVDSYASGMLSNFGRNVWRAFNSGQLTTKQAMKEISTATNRILHELGMNKLSTVQVQGLAQLQLNTQQFFGNWNPHAGSKSSTNTGSQTLTTAGVVAALEGGGLAPGSEFGLTDTMTLVDPLGRPRAKMAGDEGIFTRHQMPWVEAGLQAIGFQGSQDLWQRVNTRHSAGFERGGWMRYLDTGGYVYPFPPGTTESRVDQGVDANMPVGAPIGPMGRSRVMGITPNWYMGQPFMWWQLLSGARAGRYGYVAEQIVPKARPGQIVNANQAVATYAGTGTGIEYGWSTSTGQTLAHATTGYTEGEVTPAGMDMRTFLTGLKHGKILGGGALGGLSAWTDVKAPHITGTGTLADIVRKVVNTTTRDINQWGQAKAGTGLAGRFAGQGGSNAANEALGRKMMLAAGWGANQWPYLQALWTQESGWNANAVNSGSGAYGIPQALGHGHPYNLGDAPAQIAWGLSYIRQRYGSPQAAEAHERANNWYAGGGYLPGFAGGRPYAPLPGGVAHYPGFRPPRARRGAGGLHVVGGHTHSSGATRSGATRTGTGGAGRPKTQARRHQGITQTVAATLQRLGFGTFAADQTTLGNLDQQYSNQENLFSLFDTDPAGMPQADLDTLMGIREKEWDILYKEWTTLPAAINQMKKKVTRLTGTTGHPAYKTHRKVKRGGKTHTVTTRHPTVRPSGVAGLTAEVQDTEDDITALSTQATQASRQISTIHHTTTKEVMQLTDQYAGQLSGYLRYLDSAHRQLVSNSRERIRLHRQMRNLPSSKTPPSVSTIVSGVMSGDLTTPASTTNPARTRLEDQISSIQDADLTIQDNVYNVRQEMHQLLTNRQAAARSLREQGFDSAWAVQLRKWRIQDTITKLRQTLKTLKAQLVTESAELKQEQSALSTLEGWQSGGLQGGQSVSDSLESIIYDMLDLHRQGSRLPTPPRTSPTFDKLTQVLTGKPPKGLGLAAPAGLTTATAAASASEALADFQAFQASRAALFSSFGSNFAPAGVGVGASPAALGAGLQYFGAAAGPSAGAGATPGGMAGGGWLLGGAPHPSPSPGSTTTINIEQHFGGAPADPHTYSAGLNHELSAMA